MAKRYNLSPAQIADMNPFQQLEMMKLTKEERTQHYSTEEEFAKARPDLARKLGL